MEDIAEALELSVSGAKMRVHRGIAKLREMLSDNRCGERNESQSAFSEKRSIA